MVENKIHKNSYKRQNNIVFREVLLLRKTFSAYLPVYKKMKNILILGEI